MFQSLKDTKNAIAGLFRKPKALTLTPPPDLVMCATHGEVERSTVWANAEPEVIYNYCGKCLAAWYPQQFPVTEIQS